MLGWTIDTVAMVIYLASAKLFQLCLLLEAWRPARTVASEYELRSLMGKLLHVSEVVRPGVFFVRRIINQLGISPVRSWDERFGVSGTPEQVFLCGRKIVLVYIGLIDAGGAAVGCGDADDGLSQNAQWVVFPGKTRQGGG